MLRILTSLFCGLITLLLFACARPDADILSEQQKPALTKTEAAIMINARHSAATQVDGI